jgi:fluoroquinolone transport system permease protein
MNIVQQFKTFGPVDSKYIRRDDINAMLIIAPFLLALAVRWLLPFILEDIGELIDFDLFPYFPPIMGYVVMILMPLFSGMITGLILLDQKDDHTILGLQVSPVPMTSYLTYRLATPMLLSLVTTLVVYPISGLQPIGFTSLLANAILAMPLAPLFALIFAIFAENKIQGLVLMKASGSILFLPIASYFLPAAWKYISAIIPTFWPGQFYWYALEQNPMQWIIFLAGMLIQAILIFLLQKLWIQKIHS